MFAALMRVMMPGVYRLRAFEFNTRIVSTNKGPYVPYRGPWADRDVGARAHARRHRSRAGDEPDRAPAPQHGDRWRSSRDRWSPARCSMSACLPRATLDKALELADLERFRVEQQTARSEGRLLGIGIATYHEAAPGPPGFIDHVMPGSPSFAEPARTVLEDDGTVSVYIQQMPHGQSHETTFAQVAADELGVSPTRRDREVR